MEEVHNMNSRMCAGCDTEIPAIRLKAKPNARFCVSCQSSQDVVIAETPLVSAFAIRRERTETEDDLDFSAQSARGLLSTGGLSAYIASEQVDYSGRASNTGHIVFSERAA
jgi:hypothetical protein